MTDTLQLPEHVAESVQATQDANKRFESQVDSWWNSISQQDRERAFYAVCSRIYLGDVENRGTFRHVLYDVFGFDRSMYRPGVTCGYLTIHNCIAEYFSPGDRLDDSA